MTPFLGFCYAKCTSLEMQNSLSVEYSNQKNVNVALVLIQFLCVDHVTFSFQFHFIPALGLYFD